MTSRELVCPHCGSTTLFEQYHAGFSDLGFMYCDRDATVVTWSSYDPIYSKLVGAKHPWTLDERGKQVVESNVIACPCGGRFTFASVPRCPRCLELLPDLLAVDRSYVVILADRQDGEHERVWRMSTDEWEFVESVEATDLPLQVLFTQFRERHPEFATESDDSFRVDHVLTGRNPVTNEYRFLVKKDASGPEELPQR